MTGGRWVPVIDSDFPDPALLTVGPTRYAYATNGGGRNVRLATSTDGQTWTVLDIDPLPVLGAWATVGRTWAPDVVAVGDHYGMYYTATDRTSGRQGVGTATATSPAGPFTPAAAPLACPAAEGGAIDPAGFTDADGTRYVVYKVDGNALAPGGPCGNPDGTESTPIRLQRLESDGVTPVGPPTTILDRGAADGPLVEAPSLVRHGDHYVLFFSSHCYNTDDYDTRCATAPSVDGPYVRGSRPLLTKRSTGLRGPGGADVSEDASTLLFHATLSTDPFTRGMFQADLAWDGDTPTIG